MLIRMLTSIADSNGAFHVGDLVNWEPDGEAQRLVDRGYAEVPEAAETAGQRVRNRRAPVVTPPPARQPEPKGAIAAHQGD